MEAVTATTTNPLVGTVVEALVSGNWWLLSAVVVYALIELLKGRIPGTKVEVPAIKKFINANLSPSLARTLAFALSLVLAIIYYVFGLSESWLTNVVVGWAASWGIHDVFSMLAKKTTNG